MYHLSCAITENRSQCFVTYKIAEAMTYSSLKEKFFQFQEATIRMSLYSYRGSRIYVSFQTSGTIVRQTAPLIPGLASIMGPAARVNGTGCTSDRIPAQGKVLRLSGLPYVVACSSLRSLLRLVKRLSQISARSRRLRPGFCVSAGIISR